MLQYPGFNPIAFSVGPVKVHWYGIMYLLGFGAGWALARLRAAKPGSSWKPQDVDDLIFYAMLGVILGGRIGYVLFYGLSFWAKDPLYPLKIWDGGMSFHGGMLGVIVAVSLFAWRRRRNVADVLDFTVPLPGLGLFFGRIGNFINAELWGKPTDLPWAMIFPPFSDPAQLPRHPSQLYQFALEGVALFIILWLFSRKPRPTMAVSGMFALFYGIFRFVVEFVRVPDVQLGYLAFGWVTMGQILCIPMVLAGAVLLWLAYRRNPSVKSAAL